MQIVNNKQAYGLVAIILHWFMAVALIGVFIVGDYMVGLTYYDPWYIALPHWHKSIAILLMFVLAFRLVWRLKNKQPDAIGKPWQHKVANGVHQLLYLLMAVIMVSGYLISSADGKAIAVFNWFDVPAIHFNINNQQDVAGIVHEVLSDVFIALVILHTLAAFKHHFINRDQTLTRILRIK